MHDYEDWNTLRMTSIDINPNLKQTPSLKILFKIKDVLVELNYWHF